MKERRSAPLELQAGGERQKGRGVRVPKGPFLHLLMVSTGTVREGRGARLIFALSNRVKNTVIILES